MQLETTPQTLQSVLDAMPDMLRVLDQQHRVVLINASYRASFGDQCGRHCYEMFCVGGACNNCVTDRAVQTGLPQDKRRRFQGRTYWVKASPLFDSAGTPAGVVEVFRDITPMVQQEKTLREQNKRLLQEANLAARMQKEMFLPTGEMDKRISLHSRYLPAATLGGDLFGCFAQKDGRICFYVADVSGHGIAAAMVTLVLVNTLRKAQADCPGPAALLSRVREAFLELSGDEQLYVTMFIGELDPNGGRLIWANAGHNATPLLAADGSVTELFAPSLPVCNWFDDIIYTQQETVLPPGGQLLVYTDGLLDHHSSKLSQKTLEEKLLSLHGEDLLEYLEKQILTQRWDDVCMLLIGRQPGECM